MPTQSRYDGSDVEAAYKLAREQLARIEDIEQLCVKSEAKYLVRDSHQIITIQYLNQSYLIVMPGVEILLADSGEKVGFIKAMS